MKILLKFLAFVVSASASSLWAAEAVAPTPTSGILKMLFGLVVVLAVMALVTWALKRMMPGIGGQQSAVRIVGGVSVGSRERIVVLEVAGRWLVVGVAPGRVNAIANLDIGATIDTGVASTTDDFNSQDATGIHPQTLADSFAQRLKKSVSKFSENNNAK
ncbi:MAG: flagellar biosynthetic protein FliO [Methylotenera sp.]|nr:flagellar biosynthetic protein FliO [Methylotenera sp.]NOU40576.1 flagellar biosynthetic protein FliO [Methylotenera sp.]